MSSTQASRTDDISGGGAVKLMISSASSLTSRSLAPQIRECLKPKSNTSEALHPLPRPENS